MMADVTGGTPPTNASPFGVPADIKAVYDHFGDPGMFSVASAAALPASGNWVGRQLWVVDVKRMYVCTATPGSWQPVSTPTVVSLVSAVSSGFTPTGTAGHPYEPRLYVQGSRVEMAGAVTRIAGATMGNILTIPSQYVPPRAGAHFLGTSVVSTAVGSTATAIAVWLETATGRLAVPTGYETSVVQQSVVVPLAGLGWYLD